MTREADMALLEFCARQFENFDEAAWGDFRGAPREVVAAAVAYLALSEKSGFGHRVEMERVAEALAQGRDFAELARSARFDFARFGPMLEMRLRHACPLS
jgi:hypothetical protein